MNELEVTSIQHGCVDDGEGVRTVIFFRGCPFCCPWCCNPETIYLSKHHFIDEQKCLKNRNECSPLCVACERYGGLRKIEDCPFGVCMPVSRFYSTEELLVEVLKDKELYELSGGGVTLSGGDPISHLNNLYSFLSRLYEEGVSCAIETSLYASKLNQYSQIIHYIDEWIVDLKLQPENTRRDYLEVLKKNLELLRQIGRIIKYRLVYVDTLRVEVIMPILFELNIDSLEVLKCHFLARNKYKMLGLEELDYVPSEKNYKNFAQNLTSSGIQVVRKKA